MNAPERIETARLVLRRPRVDDAGAIYERYAGQPEVTRLLSWPTHMSIADTLAFLEFSDSEWARWSAGPYLITSRTDQSLLGSTGLSVETRHRATTGYVLARDAWAQGLATEALRAMVDLAVHVGLVRLQAFCHPQHAASRRVLEKGGFVCEGTWHRYAEFPNLSPGEPLDVLGYAKVFGSPRLALSATPLAGKRAD